MVVLHQCFLNTGADKSYMSKRFSRLIKVNLSPLDTKYSFRLASVKLTETRHVIRNYELELSFTLGSFDIIVDMDRLPIIGLK
jgi:hypothetical protein